MTYGLTHLAIAVNDIHRTLQFYKHIFGMEVMYMTDEMLQLTTPGCHDVVVFEKRDAHLIGSSGGIAHFGFRLRKPADIDNIVARINDMNAEILEKGEFVPGSPYIFFRDPDGYILEVWYELDVIADQP